MTSVRKAPLGTNMAQDRPGNEPTRVTAAKAKAARAARAVATKKKIDAAARAQRASARKARDAAEAKKQAAFEAKFRSNQLRIEAQQKKLAAMRKEREKPKKSLRVGGPRGTQENIRKSSPKKKPK